MASSNNKLKTNHKRPYFNPAHTDELRTENVSASYSVYQYNKESITEDKKSTPLNWNTYLNNPKTTWINVDGINKEVVEHIASAFNIHPLFIEDILSIGQRAKMDTVEEHLFCLLPMIYYKAEHHSLEMEQVSILLGKNFVLSFQEDVSRDVFNPLRSKLKNSFSRVRERGSDYLCYALLDEIVDSYFAIIQHLRCDIEIIEQKLLNGKEQGILREISTLRKEIFSMKQAIAPVKELIAGILRSGHELIEKRHEKYYKDILDHIHQVNDDCEVLRDSLSNLQDLYMNQINLRMNQVMKVFTMVSLLLAPATVIGGIFGMNFDQIPLLHDNRGFYFSVALMLVVPLIMLYIFKKKNWLK